MRSRMAEKLGLSTDQQKAIDDLRTKQHAELQALKADQTLAPEARRDKTQAIIESFRAQMRAVLTPEQQQKVSDWRQHMRDHAGRFAGGREGRRGPAMQPGRPADPLAIIAMGDRIKDRIAEKLQLTDEQRDKLEHLGRAYRAQQREAAKKHLEEMRAVLTPEQQQKMDELKQHFRHGPAGDRPPFLGMSDTPGDEPDDAAGMAPNPPEKI